MTGPAEPTPQQDKAYHTYTTHRIPWFIRLIWVAFYIGLIWYLVAYAVPSAKNYFWLTEVAHWTGRWRWGMAKK